MSLERYGTMIITLHMTHIDIETLSHSDPLVYTLCRQDVSWWLCSVLITNMHCTSYINYSLFLPLSGQTGLHCGGTMTWCPHQSILEACILWREVYNCYKTLHAHYAPVVKLPFPHYYRSHRLASNTRRLFIAGTISTYRQVGAVHPRLVRYIQKPTWPRNLTEPLPGIPGRKLIHSGDTTHFYGTYTITLHICTKSVART